MSIALYDDFDNPVGEFPNYETYDAGQQTQLAAQRHVDIRTFEQDTISASYTMFDLETLFMGTLDTLSMALLETATPLQQGEAWTNGAVGPQSDRNHFNGVSLNCTTGVTTTSSVSTPVDIGRFSGADYISLSLPDFPLTSLDLVNTFLDLTSESSGNFATGPTDSLPFNASTLALSTGDSEARLPLSLLTHVDRSNITAVRFRIQATGSCTFRCLAIRAMAASWAYGPVDQDTLYKRLGATVPPSGSLTDPHSFPIAGAPVFPSDWPVLLRTDPGTNRPGLVDIEVGAEIKTGFNGAENTFTLYLRELPTFRVSMSDLDSRSISSLENAARQPDFGPSLLNDFSTTRYLTVTFQWGSTGGAVHILDETGAGYDFTGITLSTQTLYYLFVQLSEDSLRVRLYPISELGIVDWATVAFDSTAIVDDSFIVRRRGRFGWYAQMLEGNTYIQSIRPRRTVYSEYRSAPLPSATPVEGARLYASSTGDVELYDGASPTVGASLSLDVTKSRSGRSLRVQCDGNFALQGLITSVIRFENFFDTEIEFDVLAPTAARLVAFLRSGRLAFLPLPPFPTNRWTHIRLSLAHVGQTYLPGPYTLSIIQTQTAANTWYIDNLSIHTKAVAWAGRSQAADAWRMNNPPWIKFGDQLNDPYNGALLGRGNALQIRGQALTQDAEFGHLKVLPQYMGLGHFVWKDQSPATAVLPTPLFTTSLSSTERTVECDGTSSSGFPNLAAYYWSFGDGSYAYGGKVSHTYEIPGTYTITLTAIDLRAQKCATTHTVTVT